MRDFTEIVKENVREYRGLFASAVRWAPIFAATLMTLSQDPRLQQRHRNWVNAALAYFVEPDDAVPEQEYGPYGYIDDNFVSAYVLKQIAVDIGWKVIEDAWAGDARAREVAQEMLDREQELLGDLGEQALVSAGVLDPNARVLDEEEPPPIGLI